MSSDEEFESGGSGASLVTPKRAGELKKGMVAFLKEKPCKIIDITTSKTGKHGHAKANITGIDIFTGKKVMDISPTSHTMYQPVVDTNDWTVTDIDDEGFVTLMDDDGNQKEDLQLPTNEFVLDPELGNKIKEAFENDQEVVVKVQSAPENMKAKEAMEAIISMRIMTED
jgi:translation initiation factor 5A